LPRLNVEPGKVEPQEPPPELPITAAVRVVPPAPRPSPFAVREGAAKLRRMASVITPGRCRDCGGPVPATAAYCPGCAAPVERGEAVACPACRQLNRDTDRFCSTCGAHMASVADAERRVVTVLFADLSGFTPLSEEVDAETVRDLIAGCLGPLCDCVTRHGGFVDKFIGDCVMALFGAPVAYENEEERAIRAALDMHVALDKWAEGRTGDRWAAAYQPRLSIGINTGPVVTGHFSGGGAREYTAVGDAVNVAARLQGHCDPSRILVGPMTYRLARHLFEFGDEIELRVKGRQEPVRTRYVLGPKRERGRLRGVGVSTPLVGRAAQLDSLSECWELARSGRPQICTLVGPPGIGKTRLVEELVSREALGDAQLVRGRSYPYARSTPWEALAELVRDLYGIAGDTDAVDAAGQIARTVGGGWEEEETASLAAILGGPAAADPGRELDERQDRAAAVLRRVLSWRGRAPRLLVLEDLHWADGSTLSFLSGLSPSDLSGPILLVLVTRPPVAGEERLANLLDAVPDHIEVPPLTDAETRELIDATLGGHRLGGDAIDAIVTRADGMPLFVEETLKSLMATDTIRRAEDGVWEASGDFSLEVPDTIESVLSTRIDALRPSTKRALQYAAIVGRRFWPGILSAELVGGPVQGEMETLLEAAFIREHPESLIPREPEHRFEHLMLHEVAYEGVLRSSRERIHGSVARWLETHVPHPTPETDDLVAFHYERSDTPRAALPFLERGARAAMSRGGLEDARAHLRRALDVSDDDRDGVRLWFEAERLAGLAGDAEGRETALEALVRLAMTVGDPVLTADVTLRRAEAAFDHGDLEAARGAGLDASTRFEVLDDISKRGDTLRLLGREAHQRGDHEPAERYYEEALELERRAGDRWGEAELLDLRGMLEVDRDDYEAAVGSFDRALGICEEIEGPRLEARVLAHRATALRWMGCLTDAASDAARATRIARACGSPRTTVTAEVVLGGVYADAGRLEEADALLRRSLRAAMRMSRPALEAEVWLELSWMSAGPEAVRGAREAERVARQAGVVHVEVLARARSAELALEAGDVAHAERESAAAVAQLERHGTIVGPEERVWITRSRVLRARGATGEAGTALSRARALIEQRAARIGDPARKAAYLERHRAAIEEAARPEAEAARPAEQTARPGDEDRA